MLRFVVLSFFAFAYLVKMDQTLTCGGRAPASSSCEQAESDFDKIAKALVDPTELYQSIKSEFLTSPLCRPENVLNDPTDRLSPMLFEYAYRELNFLVKPDLSHTFKEERFLRFADEFQLSLATRQYATDLIRNSTSDIRSRSNLMTRVRLTVLQDMNNIAKTKPGYKSEIIADGLAEAAIFGADDEGNPECPFISEDAFYKALQGRENVLRSAHKSKMLNPDLVTIVDYSLPSHRRRMFVIDLKNKKVLHNTWTAHGGGVNFSQAAGNDGWGSSPKMSNESKSNLSSEGFYFATAQANGEKYGPNIILTGIDLNNTRLTSRAVVLHGWRTPYYNYVSGQWLTINGKRKYPSPDTFMNLMSLNPKTVSEDDIEDAWQFLTPQLYPRTYMDPTEGCLGVPESKARQLDRRGRNKSQLELLREDLPGSLMFNYTGPDMSSKYL
jgi:hypothetical protein